MNVFDRFRALRPSTPPPTSDVVQRSREQLMQTIIESTTTAQAGHPGEAPAAPTRRRARAGRRRPVLAIGLGAGAAAALAAFAFFALVLAGGGGGLAPLPAQASAQTVLHDAGRLTAATAAAPGSKPIRHLRFRNLTDAGAPVYDLYVRPDGSALVGRVGEPLTATDGYLTQAQIASLPDRPDALRQRMLTLSGQLGLGQPGERPERALYRLAGELLPDPGVAPKVKAAVFAVLSRLDLDAIRARNLGHRRDAQGRDGIALQFAFDEGAVDRMILDERTGRLLSTVTTLPDGARLGGQVHLAADTRASIPR